MGESCKPLQIESRERGKKKMELRKSKYCINNSIVYVQDNLGGKMAGVPAVGTSVLLNSHCQARRTCKKSVCAMCYAKSTLNQYKTTEEHLSDNTRLLSSRVLELAELPRFGNVSFVRFEAFGDLNNSIQFENYINICKVNPKKTFTLWTKNLFILAKYFKNNAKPKNLIVVASSIMLNKPLLTLEQLKGDFWFVDKVFTVYEAKFAYENNIIINCGSRSCVGCEKCYDLKNKVVFINEMLKSQQKKYDKLIGVK